MSFTNKDIEELKPAIERCAQRVLGSDNSAIVNLALTCLERGYDKKKASSKISSVVGDSQANKFTEKLFTIYNDYRNMVASSDKKRKREPAGGDVVDVENKKTKAGNSDGPAQVPNSFGELTADKIKEMMANAQKMIQQRMNQMNLPPPQLASSATANNQKELMADASDKWKRANELQASIQARLTNSGLNSIISPAPVVQMTGPTSVSIDEYGRTIDQATGLPIQLQIHTPTLKANIRAKRKEQFKAVHEKSQEETTQSKFFDYRLKAKQVVRGKKTFKFFEAGKFEKIGQRMRTKAHLEQLQNEVSLAAKRTGIATAAKLAIIQPKLESPDEVPDVEWWDAITLNIDKYPEPSDLPEESSSEFQYPINYEVITSLVEHPIQMKPPVEKVVNTELQTMLTKKERKKMRRQNRSEIQKEYQEKIRLGLLPPPEPKVRMANLMRVLGTEAVQDPTKVEAHVRAQMAKRQKAHEDANAARKLTKEQKRDKKIRKIKEDTSNGVVVCVYRVGDLTSIKKKFKIETNANQLFMTGIVIIHKDCNVIVVEGGPKQQKKFKRLVMNRIKWGDEKNKQDDDDDDEEEEDIAKTNECRLVWEGTVKSRAFGEIKLKTCPTEAFAREQFRKHSVEHYWDLAFSSTILETTLTTS